MVTVKIQSSSKTQRNFRSCFLCMWFLTTYIAAMSKIRDSARKKEEKWVWWSQQVAPATRAAILRRGSFP